MTPQMNTDATQVNQPNINDSSITTKDETGENTVDNPTTATEHAAPLSPDQPTQTLDWAEMTEMDHAQQDDQPPPPSPQPSAAEPQLTKKARQKAKQKERKASGKAAESASQNVTATQLPSAQAPETNPPATQPAQPVDAQGTQQSSHPMNRSGIASALPGRGRGRGGYLRGFSAVPAFSRGRGSFGGRGGLGSHREKHSSVAPPTRVEWPNGIAPPTMPRAQREELERKRQANIAATPSSRAADVERAPPSVTSESVPSRSGTATPATTATSSSPAPAQSFEDQKGEEMSTEHSRATLSEPQSGQRRRGGLHGLRGRGAFSFRQPSRSRGQSLEIKSTPTGMHFGSVSSSDDPRHAASDVVVPNTQENNNVVVRLPGSRSADQQPLTTLPPGFAMVDHSIIVDLRYGQPRPLGPWASPEVQWELKQASESNGHAAREPLPAHMRAIFGQPDAVPVKAPSQRLNTSIPASAALAAVFMPQQPMESDILSDAGSNDSHDPTIPAAADGTLPGPEAQYIYQQPYDSTYGPPVDMHGMPIHETPHHMAFAPPPPPHQMYYGAEAYYPIPEQHMMQYHHPSDAMYYHDPHHYQLPDATQQGYPMPQSMPYGHPNGYVHGEPVGPSPWQSPPHQPGVDAHVHWGPPQEY